MGNNEICELLSGKKKNKENIFLLIGNFLLRQFKILD